VVRQSCHERALGLLAVRPRTRWEMDQRLRKAGFELEDVQDVLERLERVGLIDDRAFAEQFSQQRFDVKRSGSRAVSSELRSKGVSSELIAAVTDRDAAEEEARAEELAGLQAGRMRGLDPIKAYGRLNSLLMRRGYSPDVARRVARKAVELDHLEDSDPSAVASRFLRP
jgi:regulatory protein